MNLCVNARDAMPNGGSLSIEAENFSLIKTMLGCIFDASVGPYIVISVADTGAGIP